MQLDEAMHISSFALSIKEKNSKPNLALIRVAKGSKCNNGDLEKSEWDVS